jgi:hypothetical protein
VLAVGTGVLAVGLLPAMALDDRQLLGVSVWLKPWKFAVSIAVYALTVAWMLTLVQRGARLARASGTLAAVALGVEIAIITAQAARGVPSHFNTQTALDRLLFNLMGASILLVWVATLVLAGLLVRQRPADRVLAVGLRWGLRVSLLGMILAVLMVNPINEAWVQPLRHGPVPLLDGGHTVGGVDGGPGVPVANWSVNAGDLRVPHFVGIHALQLLPLVAWLLGRGQRLSGGRQVGLVRVVGLGYLGVVVVVLAWQALRGEPVTQPGTATLAAAGALLAGTAAAAFPAALRPPPPRPADQVRGHASDAAPPPCGCQLFGHLMRPARTRGSARQGDLAVRRSHPARRQVVGRVRAVGPAPRSGLDGEGCSGWRTRPTPTAAVGLRR